MTVILTMLLLLFVGVVWCVGEGVKLIGKGVEKVSDLRNSFPEGSLDQAARLNGRAHEGVQATKARVARTVVAAHHTPDRLRQARGSVKSALTEVRTRVDAERKYREIKGRKP